MSNKQSLIQKLKDLLSQGDSKKPSKYHYFLIVLVLGVAFMLISNLFYPEEGANSVLPTTATTEAEKETEVFKSTAADGEKGSISDYEAEYEKQLKEALEAILGVDDVTVVVNVDATSLKVLEKNRVSQTQGTEETDREGGKRKVDDTSTDEQVVVIREGEKETPIILQVKKPEVRGVLVVAKGADNIHIKKTIVESVTRVLGVASHRVQVAPKK
ncbi:stage III sporulation protein AG [Metabacillus herbersteinensis]|uniref:Stage III sporulation protein AG n=1 Tax=Metabacillus herbersteinensis TaxID=283816 RepID=A0ABV6G939_9BACI